MHKNMLKMNKTNQQRKKYFEIEKLLVSVGHLRLLRF